MKKKLLVILPVFGLAVTGLAAIFKIDIQDFAFVPAEITVMESDTVEWTNRDGAGHSTASANITPRFTEVWIVSGI